MAQSLYEKELEKSKEQKKTQKLDVTDKGRKATVNRIITSDGEKDKQVSAKVNNKTWENFTKINKAQGLSNNSALNMLINKYVRENKAILDD